MPQNKLRKSYIDKNISEMLGTSLKLLAFGVLCLAAVVLYVAMGSAVLSQDQASKSNAVFEEVENADAPQASGVVFSGYTANGKGWQLNAQKADLFSGDVIKLKKVVAYSIDDNGKKWDIIADEGNYHRVKREILLEGNVHIESDESEIIETEKLFMDLDTNMLSTSQDIVITRNQTIIEGKGAVADRALSTMTVKEDVRVIEKPKSDEILAIPRVTITCDGRMDIDYKKNFAIFYDNVKVIDKDSVMFADKMHVYFDPDTNVLLKTIAFGDVEILTGDKRAVGEHAVFVKALGTMVLTGDPYVYRETDVITADKITFYTADGRMICEPAAKLVLFPSQKSTDVNDGIEKAFDSEADNVLNSTLMEPESE